MAGIYALLILIFILCCFITFSICLYIKINWKNLVNNLKRGKNSKASRQQERHEFLKNFVDTLLYLSEKQIGALMICEKKTSLSLYSGYKLKANFTFGFAVSIFSNKKASFHDGAMIISGNSIIAVSCYVPISKKNVDIKYGARHRAALGISEVTDAIAFVVSETNGNISFAQKGELKIISKNKIELEESIKKLI